MTVFEKGGELEVIDEGALNFFPGTAEGPARGLGKFEYKTELGAEITQLSSDKLFYGNDLSVYYNGGCFFTAGEGLALASYSNNAVAIVENQVGDGSAILSGVHFECLSSNCSDAVTREAREKLSRGDAQRQLFQAEILSQLHIKLSPNWRNKIFSKSLQNLSLLNSNQG